MKKINKNNKLFYIGIFFIAISLFLKHTIQPPEFIQGLLMGIGIGLELLGIYAMYHDMTILRKIKRKWLKQIIRN